MVIYLHLHSSHEFTVLSFILPHFFLFQSEYLTFPDRKLFHLFQVLCCLSLGHSSLLASF